MSTLGRLFIFVLVDPMLTVLTIDYRCEDRKSQHVIFAKDSSEILLKISFNISSMVSLV